jgi:dipeptidyl-peptidase-4
VASLGFVHAGYDQLPDSPETSRYRVMSRAIPTSVISGRVTTTWIDADTFEFTRGEQRFRYEISSHSTVTLGVAEVARASAGAARTDVPLTAPIGRSQARVRDSGIWLTNGETRTAIAVTPAARQGSRITHGVPTSSYRSEFGQREGMWWSPTGTRLAFYRVDERAVPDLAPAVEGALLVRGTGHPYATPSTPGALTEVQVYDVPSGRTVVLAARETNNDVGYHVFRVRWTPDGSQILLLRSNRQQNVLDLAACSPVTGGCRTVVRESSRGGWVDPPPDALFLNDGRRFLWLSDRTGFRNLYLYDLDGRRLATLTAHAFDVSGIARVVETSATVFYTAWDGLAPLRQQLHRVTLSGVDHAQLTDPAWHHEVSVAPDGRHFVDVAETSAHPPVSTLRDTTGASISELARSNTSGFEGLGLRPVETFTFTAADGRTPLHGVLHFPSTFDRRQRYPLLVRAWPGPASPAAADVFTLPNRLTEMGFVVATLGARGGQGRGTRFAHALYRRVGSVDVDDHAAGVRALSGRSYIDRARVGIYGTSYGGYIAIMSALRHADVFAAAAASAPVTDWRHYNAIYTERYMGLLSSGGSGYERASALPLASALRGRLLLYYGTDDDNVHPSHTLRLNEALRRASRIATVKVGTGVGHAPIEEEAMMAFFLEALRR